jgi:hypothetical protein
MLNRTSAKGHRTDFIGQYHYRSRRSHDGIYLNNRVELVRICLYSNWTKQDRGFEVMRA